MKFYLEKKESVLKEVQSSHDGLTSSEAALRLEKNGRNKLKEAKKKSTFKRLLEQLSDPMIIILIVAAVISAVLAVYDGGKSGGATIGDFSDVIIIMIVVIINSVLGVYQESKAEAAIEALQQMSAATSKVLRDGKLCIVKSEELVAGDVIHIEAGDAIPADARILESSSLKIEEAALTGESVPVTKTDAALTVSGEVPLGDRKNMVYMGSTVVYGRGTAVIVGTGMSTEMGKIADAIEQAEDGETPLQIKLNQLSKILTIIVVGICIFIFAFQLIMSAVNHNPFTIEKILDSFMIAVSLAVAAIPEGLAAVVTILLSIGVTNMSKNNAIIRKLTAVETLGCAQIICSDKTGTLTQNKMTVTETFTKDEKLLAQGMSLCSDAQVNDDGVTIGEPTECALVEFAEKLGIKKKSLDMPRVAEAPFDSGRKMMSTVHPRGSEIIQFTKGAPDVVLSLCSGYFDGEKVVPMTESLRAEIIKANKNMADKALRVLCCAYRIHSSVPKFENPSEIEKDLVFIGLTGMIDPVRPEVKAAIEECRQAGIRPIMITGDHKDTAVAIAKELGIIDNASQAITGTELNSISDKDFAESVKNYSVYARVQPEHKTRIVNAWKNKGMITAMTGDGVNDAPSIKSADIGVGMGITGTDVTKNCADMILADDNFASIVNAVAEGRRIYDNIRKAIQFLLSSNLSEVLSIFLATLLGCTVFKPVHLLWINLVTDCFPALALGLEKPEKDIMYRKPRKTGDGIFSGGVGFDIVYQGLLTTVLTLLAYFIGVKMQTGTWQFLNITDSSQGTAMAFLTMSMAEIFHSYNMRSQRGSIFKMGTHNWFLFGSMAASLLLTSVVIEVPFLARAFGFVAENATKAAIDLEEYAIALALAFMMIPIVEIVKLCQRAYAKKKNKN